MTRKVFEAARDCAMKIKDITPNDDQIKEMLSFLSKIDRLAEICSDEGPSGLKLESASLPENTAYEKIFKDCICMGIAGADIDEASDHAADRYFEADPAGYESAIYFAAVFSVGNILQGNSSYNFIDHALQFLLPDGWRWREEDDKAAEAHKDDHEWFGLRDSHRFSFLGKADEEVRHRFDDVRICKLMTDKDNIAEMTGQRIASRLPDYKDGALQSILKELTYPELERALYVLPEEAEDRIVSNIDHYSISTIKGQCILYKDSTSSIDIRLAVKKLEEAINNYTGDPNLEAEYDN